MLFWLGCSSPIDCSEPESPLAEVQEHAPLACGSAVRVRGYIALAAGRPLASRSEKQLLLRGMQTRFEADPDATLSWLSGIDEAGAKLERAVGLKGAQFRSEHVFALRAGEGPIRPSDGDVWAVVERSLAVWANHTDDRLSLTEMDIEAWLSYASLCREAQGGGPLRLSVAERVRAYRMVTDRFQFGTTEQRRAMVALAPYWNAVRDAWQRAPFAGQQRWIAAAPLPPPMTSSSLGYTEAVLQGDLVAHVAVLHETLGPFQVVMGERMFGLEAEAAAPHE
jgi:hypothetical protein